MLDPRQLDEPARLRALRRYQLQPATPDEAFDRIVELIRLVLGVPIATVTLVDEHRQWFLSQQGLQVSGTDRRIAFCTHTILAAGPLVVDNARIDPRFSANPLVTGPPHIAAYLGAPLAAPDGYAIGAVCAMDRVPRRFTDGDVAIMTGFAGLVIDNFELRQIARRDDLTGFLTRRALIEAMLGRIAAQGAGSTGGALIVFDIDRFKAINDRFGHPAGDEVLRTVARRCADVAGHHGCLGRLGGEEFAWLLPEVTRAEALIAAEQMRRAVAATAVAPGNPPVTASFGIAPLTPAVATIGDWLRAADLALYEAKRGGRNRCESAAA